jgi:glyoxylase-like metal-dependent hydrolase (beta-lactamase superfamily II)
MLDNNITVPPEIIQVKAPLPFPLRWVNSYIIRGEKGLTIIDPGLHTVETEAVWEETFTHYGFAFSEVEQIVLTHYHPDHYGIAGWLQDRCGGIPVWISQEGFEQAMRLWGDGQPLTSEIAELFIKHGMDKTLVHEQLIPHMHDFIAWVSPQPQVSFIPYEKNFRMGDRWFEPIVTAGHAEGHLCFYDAERQEMFCGDHVLPQISPNVSYIPRADGNPLETFLVSLEKINQYKVVKAYPGHREPFDTFNLRVLELIAHHEDRLEKMAAQLTEPKHVYQLSLDFFGDQLSIHQMRFAMAETLAHVIYLQEKGQIKQQEHDGIFYYSLVQGGN